MVHGSREAYREVWEAHREAYTQVYTSGCTIGEYIPGLYLRVYIGCIIPGLYLRVYHGWCYTQVYTSGCVSLGGFNPGLYLRVYFRGCTSVGVPLPWLFPFHCWWTVLSPSFIPVSLLVMKGRLLLPVLSRFTVGRESCLSFSRFTVGQEREHHYQHPFHCWA